MTTSGTREPIRLGIVGAGRRRNGLGPFLAMHAERAGFVVAGVAGRDRASAERGAAAVAERTGRRPDAFESARALADAVDFLAVCSPADVHLEGLEAALAAGIGCLCEKPFVLPDSTDRGLELVDAFERRGLPLFENCQWPFALGAARALHPTLGDGAPNTLRMGLAPAAGGRAMILDSLSHTLSLAQALAPIDPAGRVQSVREVDSRADAMTNVLRFELAMRPAGWLRVELVLERHDAQPRPAWFEVDGARVDRRIGENYSQSLAAPDGRSEAMPDPFAALVYRVRDQLTARSPRLTSRSVRAPDVALPAATPPPPPQPPPALDRFLGPVAIRTRLRCFRAIVEGLDEGLRQAGRAVP